MELQFYRLERVHAGPIDLKKGEAQAIKSPTEVGTGKAKDEKAPLSEIIEVLNERFLALFFVLFHVVSPPVFPLLVTHSCWFKLRRTPASPSFVTKRDKLQREVIQNTG